MQIELNSTSKMVTVNGVEARVWEGFTKSGIPCCCFITRIAVDETLPREVHEQFKKELEERAKPSVEVDRAFPLHLIL